MFTELEIRRAFMVFQLMIILEEAHYFLPVFVEIHPRQQHFSALIDASYLLLLLCLRCS
jgi:hypothetical protein